MKWICTDPAHYPMAGAWARERIGLRHPLQDFTAISLFDGPTLIATVVYQHYNGQNVDMHVASDGGKRWMTREYLRAAFWYPFDQLKCRRVTGLVAESNEAAMRFDLALGFVVEGRVREGADDGGDLLVLGMLRRECRFLKGAKHGHG